MKFKLSALILALALVAWAQENSTRATPNATPAPSTRSCCHHAAATGEEKDAKSCCHHASQATDPSAAKSAEECCGKGKCNMKDGKACCAGKDTEACMKECKKAGGCTNAKCCGTKAGKSAMECCGGKCERIAQASSTGLLNSTFDRR